jgi:hypothetical protein
MVLMNLLLFNLLFFVQTFFKSLKVTLETNRIDEFIAI